MCLAVRETRHSILVARRHEKDLNGITTTSQSLTKIFLSAAENLINKALRRPFTFLFTEAVVQFRPCTMATSTASLIFSTPLSSLYLVLNYRYWSLLPRQLCRHNHWPHCQRNLPGATFPAPGQEERLQNCAGSEDYDWKGCRDCISNRLF